LAVGNLRYCNFIAKNQSINEHVCEKEGSLLSHTYITSHHPTMNKQVWKRNKFLVFANKAGNGIVQKKDSFYLSKSAYRHINIKSGNPSW